MSARVAGSLDQLFHDMRRSRLIRVAHTKVDDVLAGSSGSGLHRVDFCEHVWRKTLDAMKFVLHSSYIRLTMTPKDPATADEPTVGARANF